MPDSPWLSSMLHRLRASSVVARLRGSAGYRFLAQRSPTVLAFFFGVVLFVVIVLIRYEAPTPARPAPAIVNGAASSSLQTTHIDTVLPMPIAFDEALVQSIRERGYLSVSVHVALYQERRQPKRPFADGQTASKNMYWGALYGVDTHLHRLGGWTCVLREEGDGGRRHRRSLFHKRVEPGDAWRERSIDEPFDVYLLATAWPYARVVEAMERPLREALCGERTGIEWDGRWIEFGAGSDMVGFLGQNAMLAEYWDPFAPLANCPPPSRQIGVFYIAPRSALVLHRQVLEHGLYPVLFAREALTPEAYVLDGMLGGLISGELDAAFVDGAAEQYVKYQKSVTKSQATIVLLR